MEDSFNQKKTTFDIKNYTLKLIAHWYLFLISIAIGLIYNTINNRFADFNYSTNATIVLSDDFENTQSVVGGLKLFDYRKNFENEFGILKSFALNEETMKELDFGISYFKDEFLRSDIDLYKKTPFIVVPDTSRKQTDWVKCFVEFVSADEVVIKLENDKSEKRLSFGEQFKSDLLSFTIEKNKELSIDYHTLRGNKYYFFKNNFNSLVKQYQNKLNVDLRSPNSSILWLWTDGPVPERIVDYLNKLIEVYLKKNLADKNRVVMNTIEFIDSQLEAVIDSLADTEDRLQFYKQNNKILDIGQDGEALVAELDKLYQEKKLLEIKLAFYQYQLNDITEHGELISSISPAFLDIQDAILEALIIQYQKLQSERDILAYDLKKDVPALDIINLRINNILKEIKKHIENSVRAINHNSKQIDQKISVIDSKLRKIPNIEREIQNIQRRFKLNDNIYTFLLQKRTEAGITMSSNSPGAKILDLARYENVVRNSPRPGGDRSKILIISLLIPVLVIALKEFFNNKIIDKSDISKATNIPVIGGVSKNLEKDILPVVNCPKCPISESFRLVKANLKYMLVDIPNPVISFNSAISGEGKTFCSVNIAALLAKSNKKTVLLGLDLRKPKMHLVFNHPNMIGITNLLIGQNTLDEVIYQTQVENLYIIPSGRIPVNPAELIESERMQLVIEELKERFDYIILDTPPLANVADAILLERYTDLNLFIIRQNYSGKNILNMLEELKQSKRIGNMGIIINDVNPSVYFGLRHGLGFSYGYSFGYGYGYADSEGYYAPSRLKKGIMTLAGQRFYNLLKKLFS
jgi:tyrosine-protein kinase Etk/Wzc